jgi:hypothetical protein
LAAYVVVMNTLQRGFYLEVCEKIQAFFHFASVIP